MYSSVYLIFFSNEIFSPSEGYIYEGYSTEEIAGSRILYSGWVHHASLRDVEKLGFYYPERIGEYHLVKTSPARIHAAPSESNWLTAWLKPDYTWMTIDYENERSQTLSINFGKMNDPLWAYCFSYDEKTGVWLGAVNPEDFSSVSEDGNSYIENVNEYEYKGRTIYLADRVTDYASGKDMDIPRTASYRQTEVEAHWTDPEAGLCFSISSRTNPSWEGNSPPAISIQNITPKEILKYVKTIIDHNG